jgi:hypothetical protein
MTGELNHPSRDSLTQSYQVNEELEQAGNDWQLVAVNKIELLERTVEPLELGIYPSKNPEVVAFMDGLVEFLYERQKDAGSEIDYEVVDDGLRTFKALEQPNHSGFLSEFGIALVRKDKTEAAMQLCGPNGPLEEGHRQYVLLAMAENFAHKGYDWHALDSMVKAYCAAHSINDTNALAFGKVLQAKRDRDLIFEGQ